MRVVADLVRVRARATVWGPRALISPREWLGLVAKRVVRIRVAERWLGLGQGLG